MLDRYVSIKTYLGDKVTSEVFGPEEELAQYIAVTTVNMEETLHPSASLSIETFERIHLRTIFPLNPGKLEDIL